MPIKLKVFIQIAQKSQDRHKTSVAFELNNKKHKKSLQAKSATPPWFKLDLPPNISMVNIISQIKYYSQNHKPQNI